MKPSPRSSPRHQTRGGVLVSGSLLVILHYTTFPAPQRGFQEEDQSGVGAPGVTFL